jgi:hypothetical protein
VRLALLATISTAVAGAVLVWPRSIGHELRPQIVTLVTHTGSPGVVAVAPVAASDDEDRREPEAVARRRVLTGPTTVRTSARERVRLSLWGGTHADLEPNSILKVDRHHHTSVERGRVNVAVPRVSTGRRFAIVAGPYLISVAGTRFQLRVAGQSVGVDVEEGAVDLWRHGRMVRVEAGEAWTSPSPGRGASHRRMRARTVEASVASSSSTAADKTEALPPPVPSLPPDEALAPTTMPVLPEPLPRLSHRAAPRPAPAPAPGPFRDAQTALAEGHPQRALDILEAVARDTGAAAENACYEVGRILRDHLLRPRQALSAWNRYRARFPHGLLRVETDVSVLETYLLLGDRAGALAEAEGFVRRHPQNERRAEVDRLARTLRGDAIAGASPSDHGRAGTGSF